MAADRYRGLGRAASCARIFAFSVSDSASVRMPWDSSSARPLSHDSRSFCGQDFRFLGLELGVGQDALGFQLR